MTGSRNALSESEVRLATGSSAFEVIQQLRPAFLRRRGSLHGPTVFVDNVPRGGVDELRRISAGSIAGIRYFDGLAATQTFGTGYTGGIIQVLTLPSR